MDFVMSRKRTEKDSVMSRRKTWRRGMDFIMSQKKKLGDQAWILSCLEKKLRDQA